MNIDKKPWQKPELIVLVRNKPEEAVLSVCKGEVLDGSSSYSFPKCEGHMSGCQASCEPLSVS